MMDRNRRMLNTTIIYFIGNFGSKLLSFFLLPIYTAWLSPAQFGSIDLILNIIPLIGPVFTLQTTESIFRFLFECKTEKDKIKNITVAFTIYFIGIISFFALFIPYCMITKFEYGFLFGLYFCLMYLGIFVQQVMRGFQQNINYAVSGIVSTLVQGVTNILLIKLIAERSLLVAPILASFAICVFGIFKTKLYKYIDFSSFDKETLSKQLKYSIPLVPNQICWWFNGIVGKYIVNFYIGEIANGILAVATRFPNLVSTIMQIYFLAWTENSISEFENKDRDEYFSNNLNGLLNFLIFCMAGLLIVIKVYFNIAIDKSYQSASIIVPILFAGMFFNCIATFLGSVYTASKKTKDAFFTTIYAAVANILFSFIFIRYIGINGYAYANLISYIIFAIVRYYSVRKICNIRIKIPSKTTLFSFVLSLASYYINNLWIMMFTVLSIFILFLIYYKQIILSLIKKIKS